MKCPKCGRKIGKDGLFCIDCGFDLSSEKNKAQKKSRADYLEQNRWLLKPEVP